MAPERKACLNKKLFFWRNQKVMKNIFSNKILESENVLRNSTQIQQEEKNLKVFIKYLELPGVHQQVDWSRYILLQNSP